MSGISIGLGIAGLVMALIWGGLAIAGTKWASVFGFINLIVVYELYGLKEEEIIEWKNCSIIY